MTPAPWASPARRRRAALCAALLTCTAVLVGAGGASGAAAPRPAVGAGDSVRLDQVQVVGTHNAYHRELPEDERAVQLAVNPGSVELFYSHAPLTQQLESQAVRSLEIDVFPDPQGGLYAHPLVRQRLGKGPLEDPEWQQPGTKVLHVADLDYATTCVLLTSCLEEVDAWSDANPGHVPVSIQLELKSSEDALEAAGGVTSPPWDAAALDALDAEIRSVFGEEEMVTPDDVRRPGATLEESVLRRGWPTLGRSRGQVLFVLDNDPGPIRDAYRAGGRESLQGRVVFTNSRPGQPDAAFVKRNDPLGEANQREIRDLVRRGYLVRTRSDVPLRTIRTGDTTMREAAFASGAHIVSTDFPVAGMAARYGSDFFAALPGGEPVRCNPVNAPRRCVDEALERLR